MVDIRRHKWPQYDKIPAKIEIGRGANSLFLRSSSQFLHCTKRLVLDGTVVLPYFGAKGRCLKVLKSYFGESMASRHKPSCFIESYREVCFLYHNTASHSHASLLNSSRDKEMIFALSQARTRLWSRLCIRSTYSLTHGNPCARSPQRVIHDQGRGTRDRNRGAQVSNGSESSCQLP